MKLYWKESRLPRELSPKDREKMKYSLLTILFLCLVPALSFAQTMFEKYDFEGIVKLSNCSGALVKFAGQSMDSNAYVLTNGHCLGGSFIPPGKAVANKQDDRSMRIADKEGRFHLARAKSLVYATMTKTDSAIFELEKSYRQIQEFGIEPFELEASRPYTGMPVEIVSGYWERGYTCSIDGFVQQLREGAWLFEDSIRYSSPGCETIGGTSGAPIVEKETRFVVGVNNTSNIRGGRCGMNNPCEIDEQGNVTARKGVSYGQQTYLFYACLTPDFRIDTSLTACELPKL